MGLDDALGACETRLLPAEVVVKFAEGGWTIDDIPARSVMEEFILGIRVRARRRGPEGQPRPTWQIARDLGVSPAEAKRAEAAMMRVAGLSFTSNLRWA